MSRLGRFVLISGAAVALAACGETSTASPSASGSTSATAAATPTEAATSVATTLDPCQLVTASEASALAGGSFAQGKEETSSGGGKLCTYGAQTLNVFMVVVGQSSSPAAAQAEWSQQQARAEAQLSSLVSSQGATLNYSVNEVSGVGDRAAVITGTGSIQGQTIGASSFMLLKGAVFVGFSDLVLGRAGPSAAAMQAQAETVVGRLP